MLVGRASLDGTVVPDIDLSEDDPDRSTSRRHAELTSAGGVVRVRDLASQNGTRLNDVPLGSDTPVELHDGDRLSFAGIEAVFLQSPGRELGDTVIGPRPRPPAPEPPPPRSVLGRLIGRFRR